MKRLRDYNKGILEVRSWDRLKYPSPSFSTTLIAPNTRSARLLAGEEEEAEQHSSIELTEVAGGTRIAAFHRLAHPPAQRLRRVYDVAGAGLWDRWLCG